MSNNENNVMRNDESIARRNTSLITARKPGINPGLKDNLYMSRREFMDFAEWLRHNVTEEEFPPEMVPVTTKVGVVMEDRNYKKRTTFHRIKVMWAPGLYQGLSVLLRNYFVNSFLASQRDCETLFEIPIFFEEDLYAALILYGLDEKRAREFASMSARGAYKAYSRSVDSWSRISMIHGDFENFCRAAGGLPNRRMLTRIFPEQYKRFLSETKQKKE